MSYRCSGGRGETACFSIHERSSTTKQRYKVGLLLYLEILKPIEHFPGPLQATPSQHEVLGFLS